MKKFDVGSLVDDRPEDGVFRVHRDVFADQELFDLEMKYVFGRTWVFLAVEAQIKGPNDFLMAWIGKTPVLLTRDGAGKLHGFLNACPHKGARLAHAEHGSAKFHVCAYHGWAFDSAGRNVSIKDESTGSYPAAFGSMSHDLIPIARLDSYGGLIFGALSADVPDLGTHLGEARKFIDLAMEQGPRGVEFVPGRAAFTYRGNWKMQMDNGMDQYHLTSTHSSFMDVMTRRRDGEGNQEARQFDWQKRLSQVCGTFNFDYGHSVIWLNQAEVEKRPIYPTIDEVRARVGATNADWMLKARNTLIFPNMQIADATTLNVRTFRPIAPGLTEMRVHCLAPVGEAPEVRRWRLRQFEDFYNPSGFATPDDLACFESVQDGYGAAPYDYLQGYYRGIASVERGPDAHARALGIAPAWSQHGNFDLNTETSLHAPYREWARLMRAGMAADAGEARHG